MDPREFDTRPQAMKIKKIVRENDYVNTYVFEYDLGSRPGQFVMLWVPGVDEKPFSIAYDDGKEFWLTICKVGPATEALFELKEGDMVGVRGPFGTWYEFEEGETLATVAGGYGAAPMYYVTKDALKKGCKVEFIVGARSEDLLLYESRVEGLEGVNLHVSTDDGSKGFHGFNTQVLDQVLEGTKVDRVFACGPTVMMKAVGDVADKHGVDCWLSVETYMKCGFGICGNCAVDSTGELCCKKGPVMDWEYVKGLTDFAKYHRDAQGAKHYF